MGGIILKTKRINKQIAKTDLSPAMCCSNDGGFRIDWQRSGGTGTDAGRGKMDAVSGER